jgi:Ca2+/H+ antiporter, TMEM165/GDT1 family
VSSSPLIQPQKAVLESVDPSCPESQIKTSRPSAGLVREFLTAFVTIFLAELGDKTQLATLLMSAESNSPWIVFAGAASALLATSLLGVIVGRWLAQRVPENTLKTAAGTSLLAISVWLLWDIVQIH